MPRDFWAMERKALRAYRELKEKNPISGLTEALKDFEKKLQDQSGSDFLVVDGIAIIKIRGHLGNWPTLWGYLSDGSIDSYPLIIEKLGLAEANSQVEQIRLLVDTAGGQLDGLFPLMDAIKSTTKPIEAIVGARADSAGYGIVSQTDKIIASGEISEVGSIGVGTTFLVDEMFVDITSSDAPDKWPDVTTEEGKTTVQKELDEIHQKFVQYISEGRSAATGRNITPETVNSDFGRGGTMLAEAGLAAGMIDEIIPPPARVSNAAFFANSGPNSPGTASNTVPTETQMDKKTLKRDFPDVYAEIINEGILLEREHVETLLDTGSECGKLDQAIEFVKAGKRISEPKVQGAFLSARINNTDQQNRADDDPPPVIPPEDADSADDEAALQKFLKDRKEMRSKHAR